MSKNKEGISQEEAEASLVKTNEKPKTKKQNLEKKKDDGVDIVQKEEKKKPSKEEILFDKLNLKIQNKIKSIIQLQLILRGNTQLNLRRILDLDIVLIKVIDYQ